MRYVFLFFLALLPVVTSAVELDEHTRHLPLGQVMQVFEDPLGEARIEDITSTAFESRFQPHQNAVFNAGYSRSVHWVRVDLNYRPQTVQGARRWLLEVAYPPLDSLQLYLADGQGGYRLAGDTGDTKPWASREIRQGNYLFEIELQPNQPQRAYLRVASEGSIQVPLSLWSQHAYLEAQPGRIYVLGMIYGVLLAMLVYNLFIYVSIRDQSYLFYILYIAAFGLYQVSVNGAGVQFLWPDRPWWANAATPLLIGATGLFGCLFTRSFLRTAEHSRWMDRLLRLIIGFSVVVMVLALTTDYGLSLRLATALALLFTLAVFAAGILAWLRGMRVARYFIIAWSALLIGGQINTLMVLGHLPHNFLTMYASQLGAALEVVLLSMALADRINALKDERAKILESARSDLEQLNRELAESNRLKDEFLSNISHELRTPMMGVMGALELLPASETPEELQQYQHIATGSARDMMRLVNNILVLSELRAGKLRLQDQRFSLRETAARLHQQFAPLAREKGLAFDLDFDEQLPDRVYGDAEKLEQCICHLLDNAVKFTARGAVNLRFTGAVEPRQLQLNVEVIDSGIGFSDADQAFLYHQFRQVDGSMTRRYGGLGIGLAISRGLIELLGGRLEQQSRPGLGSRFGIHLRFALNPSDGPASDSSSAVPPSAPIA
ncbi:sensor histidine kinase [Stutzerimonas stutzeri]|uniref:histidine kinase n=1 Tax=Stutzerimonas stutzeri RCH2 TaxID=644801 RepID=L0GIA2_STUST|nr:7TM diverse intracellular signaling domain-containing protein [Stutzerimonas stutzeri]AGA85145.1 signal transduction histidine kinase [Stutzerimonas stutzeri RCH2]OCX93522.1 MAG: hybrid sensor histidine kinase/response regulator [Pseudomonas sp. CO183]